jgi:hypothetical protein
MGQPNPRFSTESVGGLAEWQQWVLQYLRQLGPDHETTLTARLNLARERQETGDVWGALIEVEFIVARCVAVLGATHPVTLGALGQRGFLLGATGDRAAAVAAYERLVPELTHQLGADEAVTLSARYYLAAYRDWTELAAAAARAYEALLTDFRRVLGDAHPTVALIADELAKWRAKADEDAELYRELSVDFTASDLGLDGDELDTEDVDAAQQEADEFIERRSRLVEVVDEWLAEVADRGRRLGHDHDEVLDARRSLAVARIDAEDVTGGLAEFDALIADYVRMFGATVPRTLRLRYERELRARSAGRSSRADVAVLLDDASAELGLEDDLVRRIRGLLDSDGGN